MLTSNCIEYQTGVNLISDTYEKFWSHLLDFDLDLPGTYRVLVSSLNTFLQQIYFNIHKQIEYLNEWLSYPTILLQIGWLRETML